MEKKIDIGKNAKVKIIWNVSPIDYTKETEKNIKTVFADKYNIPVSNITIEKNFKKLVSGNDTALNSENIKNITDVNFHHKLFKVYIEENEITDYDWDAILAIDSMVNNQINFDKYEKGKHYTVKWLDWSNFLSYGKVNHFDFTQLHGLVLLNGEPANKSGKSTFAYDLLHFLFFGKTHSGKADDELGQLFNIHLQNETELKVEGCINIDGTDYIIKRTLKRAGKSKKELRSASQKIEYYSITRNLIGINSKERPAFIFGYVKALTESGRLFVYLFVNLIAVTPPPAFTFKKIICGKRLTCPMRVSCTLLYVKNCMYSHSIFPKAGER